MSKLDDLKIWVSPLTNKIYAGYFHKNGKTVTQKVEITDQVIPVVMKHMNNDPVGENVGIVISTKAGELTWRKKVVTP